MKKILKHSEFLTESFLPKDLQDLQSNLDSKENNILGDVKEIITQEFGISEKNFRYLDAMNKAFDEFMRTVRSEQDYHTDIKSFDNKRSTYAAEFIYDKYFKDKFKIEQ